MKIVVRLLRELLDGVIHTPTPLPYHMLITLCPPALQPTTSGSNSPLLQMRPLPRSRYPSCDTGASCQASRYWNRRVVEIPAASHHICHLQHVRARRPHCKRNTQQLAALQGEQTRTEIMNMQEEQAWRHLQVPLRSRMSSITISRTLNSSTNALASWQAIHSKVCAAAAFCRRMQCYPSGALSMIFSW